MNKVMIVDDSVFMREHLAKILARQGYEPILAMNGHEAVRIYRQSAPSAVLMDITMPGRDGLDALLEIRQLDPKAKVIMLTALNQEATIKRAMHLGAWDYLTKPISPDRLLASLERVLNYTDVAH